MINAEQELSYWLVAGGCYFAFIFGCALLIISGMVRRVDKFASIALMIAGVLVLWISAEIYSAISCF